MPSQVASQVVPLRVVRPPSLAAARTTYSITDQYSISMSVATTMRSRVLRAAASYDALIVDI